MSTEVEPTITLVENDDGWWTARQPEPGVTTQGKTREEALENLDEAVAATRAVRADDSEEAPNPDVPWFDG